MRKKVIGGVFLSVVLVMALPSTARANSLSTFPTEEETGIPAEIYQTAEVIGSEFNICPELLLAIAERESRFQADATNGPCKGLMQLNTSCHRAKFEAMGWSAEDWSDGYKNMYVAGAYLHELFEQYEDVGIVLGVYHGESDAIGRGKSGRLSSYVNKILERSEELERIAGH